jgi:hypothetical protein
VFWRQGRGRTSRKVGLFASIPPPLRTPLTAQVSGSADVTPAAEFNSTGSYPATGGNGGRVIPFERSQQVRPFPLRPPFRKKSGSHR